MADVEPSKEEQDGNGQEKEYGDGEDEDEGEVEDEDRGEGEGEDEDGGEGESEGEGEHEGEEGEGEDEDEKIPDLEGPEEEADVDFERESEGETDIDIWEDEDEDEESGHRRKKKRAMFEDDVEGRRKRSAKSIYDVGSFLGSSLPSFLEGRPSDIESIIRRKRPHMSRAMGMTGIARINMSELTQKIVGCVIGENVTTEYPWIYVRKEIIEDNIDLHDESSDFLPVKDEIHEFPDTRILIGYAPSTVEEGQFYICITEAARDGVVELIDSLRAEQESRVRNAVYKTIGFWTSLGSEYEVTASIVSNTRPLYEIEVVSTSDLLNLPMHFTDRGANDQRDGYVELTPYRQTFENVLSLMVPKGEQTTPAMMDNEAQTDPSMPNNMWTQYQYEYPIINPDAYDEEHASALKEFLDKYTDEICDQVNVNATWDIYKNDYEHLVRSERDTHPPVAICYTEHQTYYDGKLCKERVINALSWHPLWTGIAATAYTDFGKSQTLSGPITFNEVLKACHGDNHVLMWSFSDCLSPKLILESPREVTCVSFCPFDGNVIVGGCANGQVAIWNIPGKIEQVEAVVVSTSAQVKYRIAMSSLMTWMRESKGSSIVRPAAMASLQFCQTAPITEIVWVPPYNKVDKNGRIVSLPEDTPEENLTWQFITSCEDGSVAFWDLKFVTLSIGKQRPKALLEAISPYKVLDRVFKPDYKLMVQHPEDIRPVTLTTMSIHTPMFKKTEISASSGTDVTARRYFKQTPSKQNYEMEPFILIGTAEGDFMQLTWEGYEFTTGMVVNNETPRCTAWSGIHDGPITHSVRSKYLKNVLLTVGGRIFALWRDDVMDPILWRKSSLRYTACGWGTVRPTVIIVARSDGTIEIWDILLKSEEPNFRQSVSGRTITGIYTHELHLVPQCIGFCDFNGTLRVFCAPTVMLSFAEQDIAWFEKYVDKEVDRKCEFKAWQKHWSETNLKNIERKKILEELEIERNRIEKEQRIQKEMADAAAAIAAANPKVEIRKPGQFLEEAKLRWKTMELRRMQRVILEKKGLRRDDLEKQRAPIMKLRQDARRKKRKIREILQQQNKIFEDTIAFLFPEQYYEQKPTELPPILKEGEEDEELPGLTLLEEIAEEDDEQKFASAEEEYIFQFLEIQAEALTTIHQNPYKHLFVWRKVLSEGKLRRKFLDTQLKKRSKHRQKYYKKKFGVTIPTVVWNEKSTSEPQPMDEDQEEEGEEEEEGEDDEGDEDRNAFNPLDTERSGDEVLRTTTSSALTGISRSKHKTRIVSEKSKTNKSATFHMYVLCVCLSVCCSSYEL